MASLSQNARSRFPSVLPSPPRNATSCHSNHHVLLNMHASAVNVFALAVLASQVVPTLAAPFIVIDTAYASYFKFLFGVF